MKPAPSALLRDKDVLCGAIFIVTGVVFLWQSTGLTFGSTRSMGPGFLPMLLALLLCGFGLAVLVNGVLRQTGPISDLSLRGLVTVVAALLIFAFCVRGAGLAPTIVAMVLVACLGSDKARPFPSLILAAGLAAFSVAVFIGALGLPLSAFGPWFGGY